MKKFLAFLLAFVLLLGCFAGCGKEPVETQPTETTPTVEPGLELEENGIVYESLAQKAVIKTALAYLARRARIQYADTNMCTTGAPTLYRWQAGARQHPESFTSQYVGYSNCAAFTYDVYWSALDIKIGGYTTRNLTEVSGKQRIFAYYPKGDETQEKMAEIREKFLSKLKPADLIIVRYNGAKEGNGHAMLYVGKDVLKGVEGAKEGHDIIHSTGSTYKYGDRVEKYEKNGTVQTMGTSRFFEENSSLYVFSKLKSIVILRPLEVFKRDIPENTLNRMRNMDNVMVEKLSTPGNGHTVNPGENIRYSFYITNGNDKDVTLDITDTVPTLATFVSSAQEYPCTQEGNSLKWKVTVPANKTITVSYDVQVKADAQSGQSIASKEATVGGIVVPCHNVFVGKTLTKQEQADLNTAVTALADSRLLRGAELVNALYSKALKVESVLPEDFTGILDSLYQNFGELYQINSKSPYAEAVAPGLFGGRNTVQRNMTTENASQFMRQEAIRTRLPYYDQLMVGDVLLGDLGEGEGQMYMVLSDGMLNLMTGEKLDAQTAQTVALDPVMGYKRFAAIRPSMLMDNKAE